MLVLGGGTLAVGFHNGWLRTASDSPSLETAASAQPTPTGSDRDPVARLTEPSPVPSTQRAIQDEVGVYRQKLEEAYRALDEVAHQPLPGGSRATACDRACHQESFPSASSGCRVAARSDRTRLRKGPRSHSCAPHPGDQRRSARARHDRTIGRQGERRRSTRSSRARLSGAPAESHRFPRNGRERLSCSSRTAVRRSG